MFVDLDDNLKCCDPDDTLKCEVDEEIQVQTVVKLCIGEDSCRCDDGYIWSQFRSKCVQLFRGARPNRIETTTVGSGFNDGQTMNDEIVSLTDDISTTIQSFQVTTDLPADLENF